MGSPQGWGKAPSASEPNRIWEKPRRSSLEPFPHDTRVSRGRSFSQPVLPEGTGNSGITPGGEVASSSLPEKAFQEKTEQGTLTCSTLELPLRVAGEDRTRTGNHALIRRSNPDLTAWTKQPALSAGCEDGHAAGVGRSPERMRVKIGARRPPLPRLRRASRSRHACPP